MDLRLQIGEAVVRLSFDVEPLNGIAGLSAVGGALLLVLERFDKILVLKPQEFLRPTFGIEQMYTPHQIPWTLETTRSFLSRTNGPSGSAPVYITIDTGHQCGQRRFLPPTPREIDRFARAVEHDEVSTIYLGPRELYRSCADAVRAGSTGWY